MPEINISVITSLYRCASFLQEFLVHYAKIENLHECELILIHNDPTDEELDIINTFTPPHASLVHIRVEREGLYTSWNRAARAASGQYLAIWNVDDIRTPGSLIAQKAALEQSNAAICYGDFYGTSTYGTIPGKLYRYPEYEYGKKEAFRRHIIGCFPMWRKEIHEKTGFFDEQFRLVADYEFQLRVIRRLPLVKAKPVLGYYLENAGHKLSANRQVQHRERTAVELRYRMYNKILLHALPFSSMYRINHIMNFGKWITIRSILPGRRRLRPKEMIYLLAMPAFYSCWFVKRGFHKLYNSIIH